MEEIVSGVYEIRNLINNHRYIGSSINLKKRQAEHFCALKYNRHSNQHLQRAVNKYKLSNFEFKILEVVKEDNDLLLSVEQKYLDSGPEYNICKIAGNTAGVVFSEERRQKIALANSRRKIKESTRQKHSANSKISAWNIKQRKAVVMLDQFTGEELHEFESIMDAGRFLGGVNKRVSIKRCLQGKQNTAYGYKWKLKIEKNDI